MMEFDRITIGRKAKELGFVRDTFERIEAHPMALWKCKTIEKNIGN